MLYKRKSTATEKSKRNGASISQLEKGTGILWSRECTRGCMVVRVRIDDKRSYSNLYRI